MIILKYILPVALLLLGLVMFPIADFLGQITPQWCALIILFVIYNVIIALSLNLEAQRRTTWGFQRLGGFFSGILFGSIPMACYLGVNYFQGNPHGLNFISISWKSTGLLMAAAVWKELWFRGMPLEMAAQAYTKIGASLLFGVLAVLMQMLKVPIDPITDGIYVVLFTYAISMVYFTYQSLWAAIGFHFANEFLQGVYGIKNDPRHLAYVLPLLTIGIILTISKQQKRL